jgi:hypothetical protein
MLWTRRRLVAVVLAGGLLTACSAGTSQGTGRPAPARPAPSPSASPSRSPAGPLTSPFTGERIRSLHRVLAVKIDNIVYARPQTGLAKADIVYALPVEGGLSRLLAIFSSRYPRVIGPVRSAREDDMELLRQFGRPAFAYSGATPVLLPYIRRHARIVDLYAGITAGYFRDYRRIAPYNLYAYPRRLLAQARHASTAHDSGFRFGHPPAGGRHVRSETVRYPAASFTFTWSTAKRRWLISMDGRPAYDTAAGRLGAATVVIQHTTVRTSRFLEYGSRPPYAESTGSGPATVLRGGKAYRAHWSRPDADGGTTFTTPSGQPMTFARGPVWVILAYR